MSTPEHPVTADAWQHLREHTSARIALGRAGGSLPTDQWLDFRFSHARARDAVHSEFDLDATMETIESFGLSPLRVRTRARDRGQYLKRPDLGRRLEAESAGLLRGSESAGELVIIVSDGLSATAVHTQLRPLLAALLPQLKQRWKLAPTVVAPFGRVALQDEIGALLHTRLALILLGERPGLGSPDSLGAYLVYQPSIGNTDAKRNCVSNIRAAGLAPAEAAQTLLYLLTEARRRGISGVMLKDERSTLTAIESRDPAALPAADRPQADPE